MEFKMDSDWYRRHENTVHLEEEVSKAKSYLETRIGEKVRIHSIALNGKEVLIAHEEGYLEEVFIGEHNSVRELQCLKCRVSFKDPLFAPLGITKDWNYSYMPDFFKFASDQDANSEEFEKIQKWQEKQRKEKVARDKYNCWLDSQLENIALARWNKTSWTKISEQFYSFKRQTYEFTMCVETPNFRNYTESITSTTFCRAIVRTFFYNRITMEDIETRASSKKCSAEEYLNSHFYLYHYKKKGGEKHYDGYLVLKWLQELSK